jgi:hypothetical protein
MPKPPAPLFSSAEAIMLWQGLDVLIHDCRTQLDLLTRGFSGAAVFDENTQTLATAYRQRIEMLQDMQRKLPSLKNYFQGSNPATVA